MEGTWEQGYHTAVHLFLLLSFLLKTFVVKQDKRTLLMVACAEGHVSVVQALLRCKASVNIADSVRLYKLEYFKYCSKWNFCRVVGCNLQSWCFNISVEISKGIGHRSEA